MNEFNTGDIVRCEFLGTTYTGSVCGEVESESAHEKNTKCYKIKLHSSVASHIHRFTEEMTLVHDVVAMHNIKMKNSPNRYE